MSTNRYIHFYPSQQNVYRGQNYTSAGPSPLDTPLGQHLPTFAPPSPLPLPFGARAASSSDQDSSTDDEQPELRKQQGRRRRGEKETVTARRRLEKERAEGGQQGQKRATPREVDEVHEHSRIWEGQRTQHQQQHQQEHDQPLDSRDDAGRFAARHHESTPDIIEPCPPFRSQTGLPDDPSLSDEAPKSHYHNRLVDDLAPLAASFDYVAIVYRQVSLVADVMKGDAGSHDIRAFNAALDEVAARYPAMPDGRCGMREFLGAFRVPLPGGWD